MRRKAETQFKPEVKDLYIKAFAWLEFLNKTTHADIQHFRNAGREKRIGPYPVDGFDRRNATIYQFQGCYHHGHLCSMTANVKNKDWLEKRQSLLERMNRITQELNKMGFVVVEMWECEFRNYCKANPATIP